MCEMNSVFEIPPIGKLPLNPTPACQRALQPSEMLYLQTVYLEGNTVPSSAIERTGLALTWLRLLLVQYDNIVFDNQWTDVSAGYPMNKPRFSLTPICIQILCDIVFVQIYIDSMNSYYKAFLCCQLPTTKLNSVVSFQEVGDLTLFMLRNFPCLKTFFESCVES